MAAFDKTLLILGASRCGKDHAGEWLDRNTKFTYGGTTSLSLCPYVAAHLGITEEQCYAQRHLDRELWYNLGNTIRDGDPGKLIRDRLQHGNAVAGIRDSAELTWAAESGVFTDFLWITRPNCPDPSLKFGSADVIREAYRAGINTHILANRGTVAEYEASLDKLARTNNWKTS